MTLRHDMKVRVGESWTSPTWAVVMPGGVGVTLDGTWTVLAQARRHPRDGGALVYTWTTPGGITIGSAAVKLASGTTITTSTVQLRHDGAASTAWPLFVGPWEFTIAKGTDTYAIAEGTVRAVKDAGSGSASAIALS